MATELDKLVVKIEADLSQLKKSLKDANSQIKGTSGAFDKSFKRITSSIDRASGTVLKFGAIIGTAIAGVAVKGFLDVGIQIENLQVRLEALFGSAQEGSKAFDEMVKFASKVPFTLEQIQQGSGSLAVVSKDSEELAKLLEITGNVASVTGLDFRSTAEQIQRSFAGGIASADMFRERGVRAMLGFEQGAEVSIEETRKRFEEVFGKGGKFGNASDELAKTLTGTLSMLGDKFFSFQTAVVDGFFNEFKNSMMNLNSTLEANETRISAIGNVIGNALASTIKSITNALDEVMVALKIFATVVISSFTASKVLLFIEAIRKLRTAMIGVSAATLLTAKNMKEFALRLVLGAVAYFTVEEAIDAMNKKIAETERRLEKERKIFEAVSAVYDLNTGMVKENIEAKEELSEATKELIDEQEKLAKQLGDSKKMALDMELDLAKKELEELLAPAQEVIKIFEQAGNSITDAFVKAIASGQSFRQSMLDIFQSVIEQVMKLIIQLTIVKPILDDVEKAILKSQGEGAGVMDHVTAGIGGFFQSLGFGGGKAMGGPVNANTSYMVGERGAELFVPRSAGTIVPNNKLGGNIVVEQNLNFSTGVSQTVRAEILNLLPAIQENTVNAVRDARLRGGTFAKDFGA